MTVVVVVLTSVCADGGSIEAEDTSLFHWPRSNARSAKHGLADALAFFNAVYPNLFEEDGGSIQERSVSDRTGNGRSFWTTLATFLPMIISQRDDDAIHTLPFNITDLLRMVGVDSDKIGTMVINAIVYVIELVSCRVRRATENA